MAISAFELLARKTEEISKLWGHFIGSTNVHILTGSSDTGKSVWLRQLALAIIFRCEHFLGFKLNVKYGKVLFISLEDDDCDLQEYLRIRMGDARPTSLKNLQFIFDPKNVLATIKAELEKDKFDLVIVDPWSDIFTGNPNLFTDVRRSLNELREMSIKFNCPFLILHHSVKNSEKAEPDKNRLNGSQAIEAKARFVIELRNDPTNPNRKYLTILKANKVRYSVKEEALVLDFDEDRLWFKLLDKIGRKDVSLHGTRRKYDFEKFRDEVALLQKQGRSFIDIRNHLVDKHGEENVPGLTSLKEKFRIVDGQSVNI